ncbi:hypothetical protein [Sinanaerobacter chloroacetimidivorans]|uniref:Uncharacterized protein n=1 Tax=Sinanaerobacter chloroacetimidivorans TaxID=2818044 RepID=A0A8J7W666_9FIRM|nr:hypothetical protein [Sinanaerobacter chloroacetimidivorans]MBR0600058.1 hypothetical protein [Sinanaerobacter chloroacetimidivorans]
MKKYIIPVIAIIMVGLAVLTFIYNHKQQDTNSSLTNSSKILNVNDIQADPSSFTGTITINGVMAGVSQTDSKLFGLVDTAEVKACESVGCGTFILPTKYDGKLPQVGDEINVTGSFVGSGNDLVFKATTFKILGNILPKGGQ